MDKLIKKIPLELEQINFRQTIRLSIFIYQEEQPSYVDRNYYCANVQVVYIFQDTNLSNKKWKWEKLSSWITFNDINIYEENVA